MSKYFLGLDLGQSADYTALALLEQIVLPAPFKATYKVSHLERLPLGTAYPQQVTHVKQLVEHPAVKGQITLAIDYTGCGRPVYDMFRDAQLSCPLYGISIHGGDSVTWDGPIGKVPKRDLVAVVQVLLQNGRLHIIRSLPEASMLVTELQNFRVKIDPVTAHDSYSAWREAAHDDLVLALAIACWIAEKRIVGRMGSGSDELVELVPRQRWFFTQLDRGHVRWTR